MAIAVVSPPELSAKQLSGPDGQISNRTITVAGESGRDMAPAGTERALDGGGAPPVPPERPISANIASTQVEGPKVKDKVEVKYVPCEPSMLECAGTRTGCMTLAGGDPNNFEMPLVTQVSVNDGPWQSTRVTCGKPESVTIPGAPGEPAQTVAAPAPPVPTFAEIQSAYRELPFSKPTVSIQPVGLKTLVNLPTFYEATWPDDNGLQPGETSEPVQLLSWTVEFKVAAQDYRYDFGDGTTSDWTSSTGGVYPDGDITHTYEETGDVDVKVDARLTGQYRVNGGEWQDIATVADLQDEPVATLQVVGTKTRLTAE